MTFTADQNAALSADLNRSAVKSRNQAGRGVSYLESWHCIAEANRIFGFDGWSSETVEIRLVADAERKPNAQGRVNFGVSYVARVRVTVTVGDRIITREGVGAGHGIDQDRGLAHESAIKEAESDARKRSLMTFGNQFGLALYDKQQAHVCDDAPQASPPAPPRQPPIEPQQPLRDPEPPTTPAPAPAPSGDATERDRVLSMTTLGEMTGTLKFVNGQASLEAWEKNNGAASGKWDRLITSHKAVMRQRWQEARAQIANMEAVAA